MTNTPRVACIGAGISGTSQLVMFELLHPGSAVAFCDIDRSGFDAMCDHFLAGGDKRLAAYLGTGRRLRAGFRDIPHYTDAETMLREVEIDTVIIATYCAAHASMVELCVKRGVNILLEKPIAISEPDVEKTWKLLRDYPHVAAVNFTMRAAPVTLAAQRHVRDGAIGRIVSVQYINNVHYGDNYFRRWMRTSANIGDLLLQKATHDFDVINPIVGERPESIAAFGSRLVYGGDMPNDLTCDVCERKSDCPMSIYTGQRLASKPLPGPAMRQCVYAREIDIDDNHVVIIRYPSGVTASYSQTFNAPIKGGQRGGVFVGTEGIMDLQYYGQYLETAKREILIGESHIDITRRNAEPGHVIHEAYDWGGRNHFGGTEPGFLGKVARIEGKDCDQFGTIEEGYISAKMCLAAQKSIREGRVVTLDLDLPGGRPTT